MRVDTNTNGHRQWFYFSVRNLVPGTVRFNIYRFKKRYSLFQRGMLPYVCSVKSKKGWTTGGTKVSYRAQKARNENTNQNQSPTFYLTFQYKFQKEQDQVYFASGLPYTISYLNQRILQISTPQNEELCFQVDNSAKTMCGQNLPIITIFSNKNNTNAYNFIVINCRTHAGQTSCSWVLDGFMEKIMNDPKVIKWIKQNNICFKIVPILNPDGVFIGNYRTGIIGEDFNRKFQSGRKQLFPQIFALKKLVSQCRKNGKLFLFLDLHGHSVLKNSFIYGPNQQNFADHPLRNLPFTLWHNSKYFRLSSCRFNFQKEMSETARVYFQNKQNILTYTCENSLGLFQSGQKTVQMMADDYRSLGFALLDSLCQLLTLNRMMNYDRNREIANKIPLISNSQSPEKKKIKNKLKKQLKQKERETCLDKINVIKRQINSKKQTMSPDPKYSTRQISQKQRESGTKSIILKNYDKQLKTASKVSIKKHSVNSFQFEKMENQDKNTLIEDEPIPINTIIRLNQKRSREAQFKIRRKSVILKLLPESIRKKLGPRVQLGISSTSHLRGQQQFSYDRSATHDSAYLNQQIKLAQVEQQQNSTGRLYKLNEDDVVIPENFSQDYESINDSDGSSDDLCEKQKQYLHQCIKNNQKIKTGLGDESSSSEQFVECQSPAHATVPININAFKQVKFQSVQPIKMSVPFRAARRDIPKTKQLMHKSLGKSPSESQSPVLMPNMIQKKQLNERSTKKNLRQPYFLIQIKAKKH